MQTRRSFLKTSSLYSAGILASTGLLRPGLLQAAIFQAGLPQAGLLQASLPQAGSPQAGLLQADSTAGIPGAGSHSLGLQLYTVRDAMTKDPVGTLAKVAQIGYNSLEGATYTGTEKFYGMDPKAFSGVLKTNGLVMRSCHYRYGEDNSGAPALTDGIFNGTILHDWDKTVSDAHSLGIKYMVCAWLSPNERLGLDHYKKMAADFNVAGEKCKAANIQFCYHNHDFEFDPKYGTTLPYQVLLDNTDPKLVKFELDLFWATKAGQDPAMMFQNHPGRFPLWHLKDAAKTPPYDTAAVGTGTIDFKKIFTSAKTAGLKYWFVEQDRTPGSPFDAIAESITYIKANLV
jgi:sugar phosphate isomerase/epimerase